jgi:hypothetical protein
MLPGHLVDDYWKEVEKKLIKTAGVSIEKVKASVESFRADIEPKAGDMIYHQDAVETAAAVVNMMTNRDSVHTES